MSTRIPGKVYLIGAGPGDPDLLTLKAHRCLQRADAVLYDNLANAALLAIAPAAADRVYVGKKRAAHAYPQDEIERMLVERAQSGQTVVRLKGGDPFIFGRGGEEAEALDKAGVPFEVVPGVASFSGLAAYAGIPLTHREHSSSVTVVTGHEPERIDWPRLAFADTLVILMGLTNFSKIAELLIDVGRSPDTPAAIVRWATRPDQETLTGTLATLGAQIAERGMKPPATVVVGEVARLHTKLNWFERLPLFGRRVLITRPAGQSAEFAGMFREAGALVIEEPAIETRSALRAGELDRAIAELETYDWIVFTSVNGVRYFVERLDASGKSLSDMRGQLAVIGPATRGAVEALHLKVSVTGVEFVAESLLRALPVDLRNRRILIPRAAVAREVLPQQLRERGARVDVAEAYRTQAPEDLHVRMTAAFDQLRPADWVTFTSSSTVHNTVAAVGVDRIRNVRVATIGPVTSATVREFGIEVTAEASVYTTDGLVEAILEMG